MGGAILTAKDELRQAVEDLSEHDAAQVLEHVRRLKTIARWDAQSPDDEEETDEERVAVQESRKAIARGETASLAEVLHEFGL